MPECIFCKDLPKVLSNQLAYAVYDIKPITQGHMIFIPKRHFVQLFDARPDEIQALFDLINQAKGMLVNKYKPDGFNINVNCGTVAGQIIMHAHVHLIPRYKT